MTKTWHYFIAIWVALILAVGVIVGLCFIFQPVIVAGVILGIATLAAMSMIIHLVAIEVKEAVEGRRNK